MKTYNSYAEAKVANPESEIVTTGKKWDGSDYLIGKFEALDGPDSHGLGDTCWVKCNPAGYCMTYNQCKEFKPGMVVMDLSGIAEINSDAAEFLNSAKRSGEIKPNWDKCFILRAAALENKMNIDKVETQTEHQEEMSAFSGKDLPKPLWAKWSVGDSVTKTKGSSWTGKVVGYYSTSLTTNGYAVESLTEKGSVQIYPEAALCDIETPQQREDRERLEAVEEMFTYWSDDKGDFVAGDEEDGWIKELLIALYNGGYRKGES